MLVVDASFVAAALIDSGEVGLWASQRLRAGDILAPHMMPAEVVNVLRKAEASDKVSSDLVAIACADLFEMAFELYPFEPFADRVWQLRGAVSAYDAWYVALAEALDAKLATLDKRLVRAPGPRCRFETFEA